MKRVLNKILYLFFLCFVKIAIWKARNVIKPRKENTKKRILALPYYPMHYAGGHERIGDWKNGIEQLGVDFELHWASEESFYKSHGLSKNVWKKYKFYFVITRLRLKLIKQLHTYDAVWIQRAFIPFFPFKSALFENVISKHGNVIYDFYDADYKSNYNLVVETIKAGQKVTVPNFFLQDFCKKLNEQTHYIPFSFNYSNYPVKEYQNRSTNQIIIGWAGAPGNFENIKKIGSQLVKIENEFPNVRFLFVCREKIDVGLTNVSYKKWGEPGFEYFDVVGQFDIGLNPLLKTDDRTKAKTSFKCMEYMSLGIAFLTSPNGIPNGIKHEESGIIVANEGNWYLHLKELISDPNKLEELGRNARILIEKEHDYFKNAPDLIDILLKTNL